MKQVNMNKTKKTCYVCGAKAVAPINEEKYCDTHWKQRIEKINEEANHFSVQRIVRTNEAEEYLIEHPSAKGEYCRHCSKITALHDNKNDYLHMTVILFPNLNWNYKTKIILDKGIEDGETYYELFYSVILQIAESWGASKFIVEKIYAYNAEREIFEAEV